MGKGIGTIQHAAGAGGALASRRPAAGRDAPAAPVVWPINAAGSSLTNARLGTSLSPSKAEQRRGGSPSKLPHFGGTSFYWESGDRLSVKAATPAHHSQRSHTASRHERSRSREPRCGPAAAAACAAVGASVRSGRAAGRCADPHGERAPRAALGELRAQSP